MIEAYLMHEKERNAQGIPALPLTPEQTTALLRGSIECLYPGECRRRGQQIRGRTR